MKHIKLVLVLLLIIICLTGCKRETSDTSDTIHSLGLDGWSQDDSTK